MPIERQLRDGFEELLGGRPVSLPSQPAHHKATLGVMSCRCFRRVVACLMLVGLALLATGASAIDPAHSTVAHSTVVIPRVVGTYYQTAYDRLHRAGLRVSIPGGVTVEGCCIAAPYVTRVSPAPGRGVSRGSAVTLTLGCPRCGAGSPGVPIRLSGYRVPNFVARRVSAAYAWVRDKTLYFAVHLRPLVAGSAPHLYGNYIVSRQHPHPGTVLTLGRGHSSGTSGSFLPTPLVVWGTQPPRTLARGAPGHASGILGGVYSYPSCGNPFPTCTDGHVANDPVRVWRLSDHRIVGQARTNAAGRFRFKLPPGAYRVEARSNDFPTAGRWVARLVTVRSHRFTNVTLVYDNGIR